MNHDSVKEEVTLRAYVACVDCERMLSETAPFDSGHCVRTGNHTQRAEYWLDQMRARVAADAHHRKWERLTGDVDGKPPAWRCAHCTATKVDAREVVPPKTPSETGGAGDVDCG